MLNVQTTTRQDARTYLLRVENERGATAHAAHLILHGIHQNFKSKQAFILFHGDFIIILETATIGPLAGAAVIIVALVVAIFCILRKCRNTKGNAIENKTTQPPCTFL